MHYNNRYIGICPITAYNTTAVTRHVVRDRSAARDIVYNICDNNITIIYDIVVHNRYIQYRSVGEIELQFTSCTARGVPVNILRSPGRKSRWRDHNIIYSTPRRPDDHKSTRLDCSSRTNLNRTIANRVRFNVGNDFSFLVSYIIITPFPRNIATCRDLATPPKLVVSELRPITTLNNLSIPWRTRDVQRPIFFSIVILVSVNTSSKAGSIALVLKTVNAQICYVRISRNIICISGQGRQQHFFSRLPKITKSGYSTCAYFETVATWPFYIRVPPTQFENVHVPFGQILINFSSSREIFFGPPPISVLSTPGRETAPYGIVICLYVRSSPPIRIMFLNTTGRSAHQTRIYFIIGLVGIM